MGLYKRPGSTNWWYRFQFNGQPIRESAGTARRQEAEQVEAKKKRELWEAQRLGVKPSKLWDDAVVAYLSSLPESRNKRQTVGALRWLDQFLGGKLLSSIDQGLLTRLQVEKAAAVTQRAAAAKAAGRKPITERASPATINRVLGIVIAILNYAARSGWIDHVPKLAQIPDTVKRIHYITRDQAEALLRELPAHQVPMVIFALETGLRKSNVTQLRWTQVDVNRKIAWVHPDEAKAGRGIAVPLSELAAKTLEQQQGAHPEFVFTYRGRPVVQTSTKAWRAALARAGISDFRWHDLRHTWASWHRQGGTPQHVLKELGGWADDRMVSRYAHLGADHLAEYVARHEGLGTKLGTVVKQSPVEAARK